MSWDGPRTFILATPCVTSFNHTPNLYVSNCLMNYFVRISKKRIHFEKRLKSILNKLILLLRTHNKRHLSIERIYLVDYALGNTDLDSPPDCLYLLPAACCLCLPLGSVGVGATGNGQPRLDAPTRPTAPRAPPLKVYCYSYKIPMIAHIFCSLSISSVRRAQCAAGSSTCTWCI